MGFLSNLIRRKIAMSDLPTNIAGAFLRNFATDTSIRGETYNVTDLGETIELGVFYLSSVDHAFFSCMAGKYAGLMQVKAEMQFQFVKNVVEVLPDQERKDVDTFVSNRIKSYREVFQKKIFPKDEGVASNLFIQVIKDPLALNEFFRRFPEGKNSLLAALINNVNTLKEDRLRCDMIFNHYMQIFYNVDDFINNGIPIKMLEASRKLWN